MGRKSRGEEGMKNWEKQQVASTSHNASCVTLTASRRAHEPTPQPWPSEREAEWYCSNIRVWFPVITLIVFNSIHTILLKRRNLCLFSVLVTWPLRVVFIERQPRRYRSIFLPKSFAPEEPKQPKSNGKKPVRKYKRISWSVNPSTSWDLTWCREFTASSCYTLKNQNKPVITNYRWVCVPGEWCVTHLNTTLRVYDRQASGSRGLKSPSFGMWSDALWNGVMGL